jgi:hypothetical protein
MTSITVSPTTGTRTWPLYAIGSVGVGTILSALAFYADVFGGTEDGPRDPVWSWLIVVGAVAVIAAAIFGLVVRTATPANSDRRGLALALVGIPTLWAFWSGLPIVLAAAAACCALATGRPTRTGKVILVLAMLITGLGTWGALAG